VDDAVDRVVSAAPPGAIETLPLADTLGRALATPITARATLPPWDNSAMDGYAVRAADVRGANPQTPVRLRVSGVARAGTQAPQELEPGSAIRIMTGAPVPHGADSVIRVEDSDREASAGFVELRSDRDLGRNVRPGGQDMRAGQVVLQRGATLGPGQLAVAAAAGHARLDVFRPARVAILSNGDELRTLDEWDDVLRGVAIPETNGLMLMAAAAAVGAHALPPRLARDSAESIKAHVTDVLAYADVLITSGGASMGEADLFKRVLDELGLELVLWRVTLRPGSPFSFGFLPRVGGTPVAVFGLPGNPTSAFVTFELFVRPFLLRFAGHERIHRPVLRATAGERLPASGTLTHYHRVVLRETSSGPAVFLTGPQGSGLVQSLGKADGLAVVPLGVERIEPGEPVEVLLIGEAHASQERPGYRSSAP
jgi:molybdopterin molybdotransferase